jgi:hypothetical protein
VFHRHAVVAFTLLAAGTPCLAADEFRIAEVASVAAGDPAQLKPRTIAFADHLKDELADPGTGLIRFEDWERARPLQKQFLSLHPAYVEPTIDVTLHGITKPYKEKLHMYVAEARFVLARPPGALDLSRYASLQFLERVDPAIKHRLITAADAMPHKDRESAHNRHPQRRWCEGIEAMCIESRYQLEGRLPLGIRLVNKLTESGKKIAEHVLFQSELRRLRPNEIDRPGLARLTGLGTPIAGALEQSIFHVNQIMQFGKFLAVFQQHPTEPNSIVVTAFVALAVESDVLDKRKEFETVPVLRNLVPAQVLVGKSSFNTGQSISAGLPDYARNRIKAVAAILEQE